MEPKIVTVGYPDFWETASGIGRPFYRSVRRLHPELLEVMKFSESVPLAKTVKTLAISVACTYSGISILTLNGHGLDAMRLARSIFEGAVTAAYLVAEPTELDPYLAYTKVSAKKLLEYKLLFPNSANQFSRETADKINSEYLAVRHLFPGDPAKIPSRWSRLQIAQMFERVGVGSWYQGFYHLASSLTHMDGRGMYMHFGLTEDEEPEFHFPPSEDFLKQAHAGSQVAVHLAMAAYARCTSDPKTRVGLERISEFILSTDDSAET